MSPKRLIHIFTIQKINRKLQTLRYKRREQKKAKRNNLKHQKLPSNVNAGITNRGILKTMLPWCGQRKSYKNSDCEKGIDIDETVQRCNVDAGGRRRGRGCALDFFCSAPAIEMVFWVCFGSG